MHRRSIVSIVLAGMVMGSAGRAASQQRSALMVIPARQVLVQLARDAATLRPVTIVAYTYTTNSPAAQLHVWRPAASRWDPVTPDAVLSGDVANVRPGAIVLVADERFPRLLVDEGWWTDSRVQVSQLTVADVVNTLHGVLKFNEGEWNALAKRYRLKLEDFNAERKKGYTRWSWLAPKEAQGTSTKPEEIIHRNVEEMEGVEEIEITPPADQNAGTEEP